jgi:PhnB protein
MKAKKVNFIPKGYNLVMPYLSVKGAAEAIAFYKKVFGVKEVMRMAGPNETIGHAEIQVGDSRIMLADEFPEMNFRGPRAVGGTPVTIHLYVQDVDKVAKKAVGAGAKLLQPVADQFYGDRSATLEDPFGHMWHVATHIEDIPMKELKKRAAAMAASAKKG